jgi:hypothetical protein
LESNSAPISISSGLSCDAPPALVLSFNQHIGSKQFSFAKPSELSSAQQESSFALARQPDLGLLLENLEAELVRLRLVDKNRSIESSIEATRGSANPGSSILTSGLFRSSMDPSRMSCRGKDRCPDARAPTRCLFAKSTDKLGMGLRRRRPDDIFRRSGVYHHV